MDPNYKKIRHRLSLKKGLVNYNEEELKYLRKILGKAAYTGKDGRPQTRAKRDGTRKSSDILECKICDKKYRRSCKWRHEQTRFHKQAAIFHDKMYKILIN